MKIKIAHLYYDMMNLYGENGNIRSIKKYLEDKQIKYEIDLISLNDKINFEKYDLFYMGMGTEKNQELVIKDLKKYKKDIKKSIENNKFYLMTGNAYEIFGKYIIDFKGNKIKCLNIFPYYTKRIIQEHFMQDCNFRIIGTIVGSTNLIKNKIIGFQNRGGTIHDNNSPFLKLSYGVGNKPNDKFEGYIYKNFIATYTLGPIMIRNPFLTEYLINKLLNKSDLKYNNEVEKKAYYKFFENFPRYKE